MHTTSRLILFCCLLFSWTDNIYSWGWSDVTNIAHQARIFLAVHVVPRSTPLIGANATPFGKIDLSTTIAGHAVDQAQDLSNRQAQNISEIESKLRQITDLQAILNPLTSNVAKKDEAQSLLDILKVAEKNIQDYISAVSHNFLTENEPSLYIPKTQHLNKLDARIHALSDTTDLSLLAHVAHAQENIPDLFTECNDRIGSLLNPVYKRIAGNILGSGRYVKALAVPQHGQDVVVGVVGSLTALGALSLLCKEPGAGMTLGSMTTGFAGAIACKRLLSQSFHNRLEDLEIGQILIEFKSDYDRLTSCMKHKTIEAQVESIGNQALEIKAQSERQLENLRLQQQSNFSELSNKIDQSSHEQRLFAEQTTAQNNQLSAQVTQFFQNMQERLDKATTEFNTALHCINNNCSISRAQMLQWLNDETQARERFQSTVLNRLDRSEQMLMLTYFNSVEQLFQQKKSIELQILALQNQGISVPQLTAGSAVQPLQIEMNGQPQRLLLCVDASQSCHSRNDSQIMKNFNKAYLSSRKQPCSHEQVARTLKAAAGGFTGSSIKMQGWQDFADDSDRRQFAKNRGQELVSNTIQLKNIPKDVQRIAACTIQNAMKNKYLKKRI